MKRSTKQLLSVLLVIAMMASLLVVPAAATGETSSATDGKQTLDFSTQTAASISSTLKVGDYFTVYGSSKAKIDANKKSFSDGYTATQRFNPGAKSVVNASEVANVIGFTTTTDNASVKVWWVTGGGVHATDSTKTGPARQLTYYDATYTSHDVTSLPDTSAQNEMQITDFKLGTKGTYYIGSSSSKGGNYIFKVEVTETAATTEPTDAPTAEPTDAPTAEPTDAPAGKNEYTLSVDTAITNGTVTTTPAAGKVAEGTEVTVTATPAEGYEVETIKAGDMDITTTGKFSMPGVDTQVTATFKAKSTASEPPASEQPPVVDENKWVANLEDVKAANGGSADVANELLVPTKVTGVKFYLGGGSPADEKAVNTYKIQDNSAEKLPNALTAGVNPRVALDAKTSPTEGNPMCVAGTYFKWVAEGTGVLNISGVVNGGKPIFVAKNGVCVDGYAGDQVENKGQIDVAVPVSAGDEVCYSLSGSKPMLVSFDFEELKAESASWTANLEDLKAANGGSADVASELEIDTKTPGVKFFVGGGSPADEKATNTYKIQDNSAEKLPNALTAGVNPRVSLDAKTSPTKENPMCVAGTYFKWVADSTGVLEIDGVVNGGKPIFVAKNGTCVDGYAGDQVENKGEIKVSVSVKAGDTVIYSLSGSKPMLVGFTFTKSPEMAEKDTTWTMGAICGGKIAVTGEADNTKGTITVTVKGPRVGTTTDIAAATIWKYADEVVVEMYDAAGKLRGTKSDTTSGTSHKVTFNPPASGAYTFKAMAKRANETTTLDSEASAPVSFILPLENPVISTATSNGVDAAGVVSMNVMWAAVAEADSYKLFVKETSAAAFPAEPVATIAAVDGKATYSYAVPGLTVDGSYDFKVVITRAATNETLESEVVTSVAGAKKVTPWRGITFGTSATDLSNCVIGADTKLTGYQDPGKTATVNAEGGNYKAEFKDYKGDDVVQEVTGLTGDLNTDPEGRVLLSSRDGAGKIKENEGADGMMFYYTAIPAGTNYTLKANVEVLRWATSNTQNGVGLAAMDRVPAESWTGSASSNSGNYWDNVYYVGAARTGFSIDLKGGGQIYSNKDIGYDSFTKYSYYMGIMSIAKYGIPMTENGAYEGNSGPANYYERRFPLDTRIARDGVTAKAEGNTNRFNLIGNYTVKPAGFSRMHEQSDFMEKYEMTKFTLQIQKNNTGYVSTLWDENGNKLGQNIDYFVKGAMDLSGDKPYHDDDVSGRKDLPDIQKCLDGDFEYVGFFTSREMDALFSNVELTTIAKEDDAPAEAPPTSYIAPSMSIASGSSSNSENFNLSVNANVEGTVTVVQNGTTLGEYAMKFNSIGTVDRLDIPVVLKSGNNSFKVSFLPDPNQALPAFTELSSTSAISRTCQVKYVGRFANMKNLFVSPTGRDTNYGTQDRPLDVYTAVSVVQPGQNIILMDGVYNLDKTIRINRGMNGTEEAPIYFVAQPGAHVVLNGQRKAGSVLVQGSDWWIFKDFEVVGASGTGFLVAGSHNLVQNVKCHDNLSTGLQISRLSASDHIPVRPTEDKIDGDLEITDWGDWPCYNTILNCDSYRNYDSGYDGADGFGAKETAGAGNVFDGCAAYWNADDGWDFYAKTAPEQGPLGRVTIRNCVAFENGYEVRKLVDTKNVIPEFEADGYNTVMNLDENGRVILTEAGNGNGFKMGGSHLPGAHSVTNSFAFYNKAKGIDSNNGPDIKVYSCTSYNNAQENIGLQSNWSTKNYVVQSTVSFKDENAPVYVDQKEGEIRMMKDSVPAGGTSVYDEEGFYQWDGAQSVNAKGAKITADSFVSLDWNSAVWANGALRDADGTLALGDFLKLKDTVTGTGAGELVNDTKPVENPDAVVNPPEEGPQGGATGGGGGSTGSSSTGVGIDKIKDDKTDDGIDTSKPASENFGDVEKGAWYEPGITYVVAKGLFQGVAKGVFAPQDNMTRAMLVTVLARLDGQDTTGGDTWYAKGAAWAVAEGVSDGTMLEQNVTRQQMVTMLYRYAGAPEVDAAMGMAGFEDVDAIDDWAADAMRWAVQNGIINGKDNARLDPQGTATRAEVATILQRFVEKIGK